MRGLRVGRSGGGWLRWCVVVVCCLGLGYSLGRDRARDTDAVRFEDSGAYFSAVREFPIKDRREEVRIFK